ncbi:MAG TPA: dethiobiotin synthase [Chthoniobacterales bacterium]|nr:dethiobiotin synthase [Chthoniobacterales bacterium]
MSFFVTGTDTGVGKTHTIVQLLRLLRGSGVRWAGMKPICRGDKRRDFREDCRCSDPCRTGRGYH